MKLAFYKGPVTSPFASKKNFKHWLSHAAIKLGTKSIYSHVELVIDDVCWSSSAVDGGVRRKVINLNSGKWDVIEIPHSVPYESTAYSWFHKNETKPYDWLGVCRFFLPFLKEKPDAYFCSEAVASALCLSKSEKYTPQSLYLWVRSTHGIFPLWALALTSKSYEHNS